MEGYRFLGYRLRTMRGLLVTLIIKENNERPTLVQATPKTPYIDEIRFMTQISEQINQAEA